MYFALCTLWKAHTCMVTSLWHVLCPLYPVEGSHHVLREPCDMHFALCSLWRLTLCMVSIPRCVPCSVYALCSVITYTGKRTLHFALSVAHCCLVVFHLETRPADDDLVTENLTFVSALVWKSWNMKLVIDSWEQWNSLSDIAWYMVMKCDQWCWYASTMITAWVCTFHFVLCTLYFTLVLIHHFSFPRAVPLQLVFSCTHRGR